MKKYIQKTMNIVCSSVLLLSVSCGLPGEEEEEDKKDLEVIDNSTFNNADGSAEAGQPSNPGTGGGEVSPDLQPTMNNLVGQWVGGCVDDQVVVFSFSEQQFVQGTLIYEEGSDCESEMLSLSAIGGGLTLEGINEEGIVQWQGDIYSFERSFYTQDLVDYFNEVQLHGYNDWAVEEAKQCIGRASEPGGFVIRQQTIFSSLQISEDGLLGFAKSAASREERGKEINWYANGGPFTKQ